ncbi:hypothetical protein PYW08_001002 [Mythimna loreyi]|uniref:Uncharacterized protein n=1 Tax=Mythimna loreyi TaxID=667449 RepID=A0ACC2QZR4_9NEOP|nr:hypothetical protein PYW08_001002 [Mythimna loreyi]
MAHVMLLDSIDEDIFVCGTCKAVFNSLQVFLDHKKIPCNKVVLEERFTNANLVQATVSSEPFSESIITLHQGSELPDPVSEQKWPKDLSCSICKKKFKKMKTLLAHLKIHSDKPYQCPICGRCFIQNSHLQRHITSHRMWPDGIRETTARTLEEELLSYTCPYCNLILDNYSQYRAHQKNHLSLKKFKCIQGDCMEYFDTVESLLQHVSELHSCPIYSCHTCNSTFTSLDDIATHQQSHNDTSKDKQAELKVYKCPQCDARFRKSEKLSLHMQTESHNKMCIHCNKTFASDKRLRLHLQLHRTFKPFQCTICNSSFHMKKYLTTHMLKHGNRQFKCSICKYTFKRQDLLQRHMKLHQAKKMLKCPFEDTLDCKKVFSRTDKLKSHIKVHTKPMLQHISPMAKGSSKKVPVENSIALPNTMTINECQE